MDMLAPFVLADGVTLTPLSELPDAQRALIPADADSVVVTRLSGRATSKVVDPAFAALLQRFGAAGTILTTLLRSAESAARTRKRNLNKPIHCSKR